MEALQYLCGLVKEDLDKKIYKCHICKETIEKEEKLFIDDGGVICESCCIMIRTKNGVSI